MKNSLGLDEAREALVPSYAGCLAEALHALWKKDVLCDYSIKTIDGVIKVHKVMLASMSPYLHDLMSEYPDVVEMTWSISALKAVCNFLYTGRLDGGDVVEIELIAEQWKFLELFEACQIQKEMLKGKLKSKAARIPPSLGRLNDLQEQEKDGTKEDNLAPVLSEPTVRRSKRKTPSEYATNSGRKQKVDDIKVVGGNDKLKKTRINSKQIDDGIVNDMDDRISLLFNSRMRNENYPSVVNLLPIDVEYLCLLCNDGCNNRRNSSDSIQHFQSTHSMLLVREEDKHFSCPHCSNQVLFHSKVIFNLHLLQKHFLPIKCYLSTFQYPSFWPSVLENKRKISCLSTAHKQDDSSNSIDGVSKASAHEAYYANCCTYNQENKPLLQMQYLLRKTYPYCCKLCEVCFPDTSDLLSHRHKEHKTTAITRIKDSLKPNNESLSVKIFTRKGTERKTGLLTSYSKLVHSRIREGTDVTILDILPLNMLHACSLCDEVFVPELFLNHIRGKNDSIQNTPEADSTATPYESCKLCSPTIFFKSEHLFKNHLLIFHSFPLNSHCVLSLNNESIDQNRVVKMLDLASKLNQSIGDTNCVPEASLPEEAIYSLNMHEIGSTTILHQMISHLDRGYLYFCELCKVRFIDILEGLSHITGEHIIEANVALRHLMKRDLNLIGRRTNIASQKKSSEKHPKECCAVDGCNYKGEIGKNMLYHLHFQHKFILPNWVVLHQCYICGNNFRSESKLVDHMNIHDEGAVFLCPLCGLNCRSKSQLHSHEVTVHADRMFACAECPYRTKTKKLLEMHLRTHRNYRPYSCKLCDYVSTNGGNIANHLRARHGITNIKDNMIYNKDAGACPVLKLPRGTKKYIPEGRKEKEEDEVVSSVTHRQTLQSTDVKKMPKKTIKSKKSGNKKSDDVKLRSKEVAEETRNQIEDENGLIELVIKEHDDGMSYSDTDMHNLHQFPEASDEQCVVFELKSNPTNEIEDAQQDGAIQIIQVSNSELISQELMNQDAQIMTIDKPDFGENETEAPKFITIGHIPAVDTKGGNQTIVVTKEGNISLHDFYGDEQNDD